MVTVLDCARLSSDVYSMWHGVTELTNRSSDASWQCEESIGDTASGFFAGVFRRGSDIVVAFRGTDLDPIARLLDIEVRHRMNADLTRLVVTGAFVPAVPAALIAGLVVGKNLLPDPATWPFMSHWVRFIAGEHEQIRLARELIARLMAKHDIYKNDFLGRPKPGLIVTGHSLGGGLAQLMVDSFYETGMRRVVGVTFNAPGVSRSRKQSLPCFNLLIDWDPINVVNSAPAMLLSSLGLKRALLAGVLGVENVGWVQYVTREEMPADMRKNVYNHGAFVDVLEHLSLLGGTRVSNLLAVR